MESLSSINKELKEAGLEPINQLPAPEKSKGKFTAKRVGLIGLVAVTVMGIKVGLSRLHTEAPYRISEKTYRISRTINPHLEINYSRTRGIETICFYGPSGLEAELTAGNGQVYKFLLMQPLTYIDVREGKYSPHMMQEDITATLDEANDLFQVMKAQVMKE